MKKKKRILGFLLSLVLVLGLMPGMGLTAHADGSVTYLDANGITQTCETYTLVTDSTTSWSAGWYVVKSGTVSIDKQSISGDVNLILCDNTQLTVDGGIYNNGGLTIYAQSTGNSMGELVASSNGDYTITTNNGNITINGGKVTATASGSTSKDSAVAVPNGKVIINGGIINATGYQNGIWGDKVEINGGTVTAQATNNRAIYGTVKNKIAGVGWTNTTGTDGETAIEASATGQILSKYKKVQFPAVKNPATVTKAPTGNSLMYTGSAQELVTAGTAKGGTMQYILWPDNTSTPTDGYTTSIPTATEAGTYYVWYKVVGDDTHTDSEPDCVTVTIEEQKQSQDEADDTQQNPDGTKTVTKENADGKTITVTNYSKTDEQISQFVFEKAKGTKLDLTNVNSKTLKTVVVPESVKANGNTYKVTRIRKGFLKNCEQATKVDIGKNINTIDKNAFNYGKKVKKVVIRGKLKKVGKNAFKNTKKNVVIKVKTSAKNFEKNKKLLEKSGLPTNATIKRVKNKK